MTTIQANSNINITNENINNINNVNPQPPAAPQNRPPRHDLPPELQNARPSGRSILARIGAFLLGAGAAGSASAFLGGGALLTSAIGVGAASFLGATAVAGIATGGAALVGGLIGLGIYAGIRGIVSLCRRGAAPQPRVGQQANVPQAQPAADAFNKSVADVIQYGKGVLPESLQQAANETVSRMRSIYGERAIPQGARLNTLLNMASSSCADEIKNLGDAVKPAELSSILEKHLRRSMAYTLVENAFRPSCGEKDVLPRELRINFFDNYPEVREKLVKAGSQEEVRNILSDAEDRIKNMAQLHQRMDSNALFESTKTKMIAAIARGLGLDADAIAPFVDTQNCKTAVRKLRSDIMTGKTDANAIDQEFDKLAEKLAKAYTDSFAAVDEAVGLSEETRKAMKMDILSLTNDKPRPELYRKGIAAGLSVDATPLKAALDSGKPKEELISILTTLGTQINNALHLQFGDEEWMKLITKSNECMTTHAMAFMAMVDRVPGLREALAGRNDINIFDENERIRSDPNASEEIKGGITVALAGIPRVGQTGAFSGELSSIQAKSQILTVLKNADIPQDLKSSWTEKTMSGEITSPATAQALVDNVPGLPAETRPLMEKFILMQSYAPNNAEASAQKARKQAQEMAGWRNFDTAADQNMAPIDNLIKGNITATLTNDQQFDRGISSQMMIDAHRDTYTINGEVMAHPNPEEVARSVRRSMPTENAAKMVSSIINQRSFAPVNGLGMQVDTVTGQNLPPDVLASMTKMASRSITNGLLHVDQGARGDTNYKVTVQNGRATIEMSEIVGLDSGLSLGEEGLPKLFGKARFTLRFDCDLLGHDGQSPSIETVHFSQQLLPAE